MKKLGAMTGNDRRPGEATRPPFLVGAVLDGTLELREIISVGPFGQVFGAYDRALGREVLVKTAWPELGFEPLRREAQALAAFHHPGLLTVYGLRVQADGGYLVLERLPGVTLADHCAQRSQGGGFSITEALEILVAISDTLSVIHAAGQVHGHLRPENIMLATGGRVVLYDFGVADESRPLPEPQYRAPETVVNASSSDLLRARDLFALGAIAFEILAGILPRPSESIGAQLARLCAGVPHALSRLVAELLADAPSARPRDAALVSASLRSIREVPRDLAAAPLSIVIADDDLEVSALLSLVIRRVEPTAVIRIARDGLEALRLVQREPPDVLFVDLDMPEMNGLEVCMFMRGTRRCDHVTIGVISRFGESYRALLKQLGVVDIFVKGTQSVDEMADALSTLFRGLEPGVSRELAPVAPTALALTEGEPVPTVAGRYAIEGQLGEGGMGRVYEVRHLQLGKRFALKVISPSFAADTRARERFNEEAKLASAISHPNIVSVVDFGEDLQLGAYMVMERLVGESLAHAAEAGMSVRRACDVLGQIADALEFIHRRGIVHGDVKAENIILVEEAIGTRRKWVPRLLDFGLAHRATATSDDGEPVAGTPHYLAPERAAGGPLTVACDIYALGVLGYYLLTRTMPFDGTMAEILEAHAAARPASLSARRGEPVDHALESLIQRALAKDVTERHASAAAFRYELNNAMNMLDIGRRRPTTGGAASRDASFATVLERSPLAQAVVAASGAIVYANAAFAALPGQRPGAPDLAALAPIIPDLAATMARVRAEGRPGECRGGELDRFVIWVAPLAIDGHVQLVVRVQPAG